MTKILITGASGFIGHYLVQHLARDKEHSLVCFYRNKDKKREDYLRSQTNNVQFVRGDIRNTPDVEKAVEGVDVIIHLAASVSSNDLKANYSINVSGARNLVKVCQRKKIKHLIVTSTILAVAEEKCHYGWTKSEAENIFLHSGLAVTILRLSLVYGAGGKAFTKMLKSVLSFPGFIPLVGKGNHVRQPVYIDDVVHAIIACLNNKRSIGRVYTLGGPTAITFKEMIRLTAAKVGMNKKIIIPFPLAICWRLAAVLETLFKNPPVSTRDLFSITQDMNVDISLAAKELKYKPVGFEEGLSKIFG